MTAIRHCWQDFRIWFYWKLVLVLSAMTHWLLGCRKNVVPSRERHVFGHLDYCVYCGHSRYDGYMLGRCGGRN